VGKRLHNISVRIINATKRIAFAFVLTMTTNSLYAGSNGPASIKVEPEIFCVDCTAEVSFDSPGDGWAGRIMLNGGACFADGSECKQNEEDPPVCQCNVCDSSDCGMYYGNCPWGIKGATCQPPGTYSILGRSPGYGIAVASAEKMLLGCGCCPCEIGMDSKGPTAAYFTVSWLDLWVDSDNDGCPYGCIYAPCEDALNFVYDDDVEEVLPGKYLGVNDDFDEGKKNNGKNVEDKEDASPAVNPCNPNMLPITIDDMVVENNAAQPMDD